jgi:nucleoside-diphosphate-sugar epimerase
MKILLTGANGFVGRHLYALLKSEGHEVRALTRVASSLYGNDNIECDLERTENLDSIVTGCDVIIHLAGRAHVMNDGKFDAAAAYASANTDVTRRLAESASKCGIRRFVFLSSVKVNGESTPMDKPFSASDNPQPQDQYGISKLHAEQQVQRVAGATAMDYVIIRTPLVYGPGVRANFASLIKLTLSGIPIPLGAVRNKRSLISVQNLCTALLRAATIPGPINATVLVSDGDDLSTPQLVRAIARAHNVPARVFWFPLGILNIVSVLTRKQSLFQRLCGSLTVDISESKRLLQWSPEVSVDESMRMMAQP